MPKRVFSEDEKTMIKEKLLSVGFPMLKEYGMIHMSIPKIAGEAGIGTGTFYRFFPSKEEYIYQMILQQRKIMIREVLPEVKASGNGRLGREEVRKLLYLLIDKEKSVYANLSLSDEEKLFGALKEFNPDIERERNASNAIFSLIDNPKEQIDFSLIFNMVKVLTITSQAKAEMHKEGYERTIERLINIILDEIFGTD